MRHFILALAFVGVLCACPSARAHFLFARIRPAAEGGRAAEVYFSEYASAGDPRYIAKVATAQFSIANRPGEFRPLAMRKLTDRLRAHVPLEGPLVVAGRLDYGVLARPGQKAFLLRHYSKAVAGKPHELNSMATKGERLEVVATFLDNHVELVALLEGKPMSGTTFTTVDVDLASEELKADASGHAVFKPERAGTYSVYIPRVDPQKGEHNGQKYDEIREFATVTFAWPLVPSGADPEAVKLFTEALEARAVWKDFPGFKAKIAGQVDGRPFDGKVSVAADGSVTLNLTDDVLKDWAEEQLGSITMHRAVAAQSPHEPPVLRFAEDDADHPLGRLLAFEGGRFATSYRVRDKQITTVNRFLDGQNMTITVLDNDKNPEGFYLPRSYTVRYWDEPTGQLQRAETVRDSWIRVDRWDLPAEHTVTVSSDGSYVPRSFKLTEHELATPGTR